MRYSLILVLLCYTLTLSGTTYYIDPSGNNSNKGSSGSPWQTLAFACSKVTVSSDIIHVNAGTYTISSQISVPVGVSIEGEGMATTTIISTVTGGSTLYLSSSSENTNGNQHISGIYFNGNNRTTPLAIMVYARGNISIYNNTFINYDQYGVRFEGGARGARSTSVTYSTGNSFHDNVVTNCAYYESGIGGGAALMIACQTGFLCYNNTVTQSRTTYTNGCGIKTAGWTKGFKIYNNTLTGEINSDKDHADSWDFAIEMWGDVGSVTQGTEIYGNNIYNWEIDISGRVTEKGAYDYGCSIHDNFIGCENLTPVTKHGIILEANTSLDDILIYRNHIKNIALGLVLYITDQTPHPDHFNNISIYYNLFENMGTDVVGDATGSGILYYSSSGAVTTISNLNIYNNAFTGSTRAGSTQWAGIILAHRTGITATGFNLKNNIIVGFEHACITNDSWWQTGTGSISYLTIQNNIFYDNGHSNTPNLTVSTPNYTNSGNLTSNPLFVSISDFHLQGTSPAVNAGLNITTSAITTDYYGATIGNPPEIGACEYGSSGTVPVVPVYVSSTVANATPSLLEMSYNTSLANIVPAPSSFTIRVNSVSRIVNTVVVTGTKVQLTLTSPIIPGDVITVSYVQPSTNPLQTTTGGKAESVTSKYVINNCINLAPTAVITSPVTTGSFASPANITITADAFDTDGSVSLVEFYNGSTKLGSSFAAPYSFTWNNVIAGNYTLTVVATDNLNATTTSFAISISVTVSNQASNRHPFIKISNPRKGISYDNMSSIEIDAIASDPDGTISTVEFYNGTEKLVALASAPYTYTWKDVAPGTYSITAIATDNLGDTTVSEPIEFIVGSRVKYDANSEMINLYPNPSDGHFSIDFVNPILSEKGEVIITDLAGKQVYAGPLLREELTKQFDLSDFKSGIYVMIVKDKDILVTKKIIKN